MNKFVLVDGYVSMDNSQLYIDINSFKKDIKERGGWLAIFFTFIGISVYRNFRDETYFEKLFNYIDFGLRVLGMITIVLVFWYVFFKRKSKKNLIINEIKSVEIDKAEFETEVTLTFTNNREIDLSFRNLENQLEPFIEALKKRNTRIEVSKL